jgi:hypothetical protein
MLHLVALVKTEISEEHCMHRLLATANTVPSSPILVTTMMEALHSSETSDLTRVTQHNILEDGILQETMF